MVNNSHNGGMGKIVFLQWLWVERHWELLSCHAFSFHDPISYLKSNLNPLLNSQWHLIFDPHIKTTILFQLKTKRIFFWRNKTKKNLKNQNWWIFFPSLSVSTILSPQPNRNMKIIKQGLQTIWFAKGYDLFLSNGS